MVRVNLIDPRNLADQHLLAEYYEILMLAGYAREHPGTEGVPGKFTLGKGHVKFFKDKLKYIKSRHDGIRKEMLRRGFRPRIAVSLKGYPKKMLHGYRPGKDDKNLIKKRLIWKINQKPGFYRYEGRHEAKEFFIRKIKKG